MPKQGSQGFFTFNTMMPLNKTVDQIRTERILAEEQRSHPPTETDPIVDLDIRNRMKRQRVENERAARGIVPDPDRRR
jgi:hypothetical protein